MRRGPGFKVKWVIQIIGSHFALIVWFCFLTCCFCILRELLSFNDAGWTVKFTSRMWFCVVCTLLTHQFKSAWFHWLLCDTWCKSLNRCHATTPVPYVKSPSACSGFSHKSVVSITHEQNVICSKTLIWRQLFANHVVSSRPMKWKEKIHRMIRYIYLTNNGCASCATFLFLPHFHVFCGLLLNRRNMEYICFACSSCFLNFSRVLKCPSCFITV